MRTIALAILALAGIVALPATAANYDTLLAQPRSEQERILRAAITTAGYPCAQVTATLFKGSDRDDSGYFAVACSDGGNWMVQILNDATGRMSVTPCALLAKVNVKCWEKF